MNLFLAPIYLTACYVLALSVVRFPVAGVAGAGVRAGLLAPLQFRVSCHRALHCLGVTG